MKFFFINFFYLQKNKITIKIPGVWSTDYIPRGTRFGPLIGQIYERNQVPENASRKYFWRIYTKLTPTSSSSTTAKTNSNGTIVNTTTSTTSISSSSSTINNVNDDERICPPKSPPSTSSSILSPKNGEPTSTSSSTIISSSGSSSLTTTTNSNQTIINSDNVDDNINDEASSLQEYNNNDYYYIDGANPEQSNWMRFVNPAYSSSAQNLVACQVNQSIYFYTIRPIPPDQELLVWYCREFSQRLNYPLTGEQMMLRIRKLIFAFVPLIIS